MRLLWAPEIINSMPENPQPPGSPLRGWRAQFVCRIAVVNFEKTKFIFKCCVRNKVLRAVRFFIPVENVSYSLLKM